MKIVLYVVNLFLSFFLHIENWNQLIAREIKMKQRNLKKKKNCVNT